MQQVIVHEPDEWHSHGKQWLSYPQTFVGPSVDLSAGAEISCAVMAPGADGTWAGLGFGGQVDSASNNQQLAIPNILAVTAHGDWSWNGAAGTVPATPNGWFNLTVKVAPGIASCIAMINGVTVGAGDSVACDAIRKVNGPFGMLVRPPRHSPLFFSIFLIRLRLYRHPFDLFFLRLIQRCRRD